MSTAIRRIMGVKGSTMSGRGHTSYCLTNGRTYPTKEIYNTVLSNLTAKFGEPTNVTACGTKEWLTKTYGLVQLGPFVQNQLCWVDVPYMHIFLGDIGRE